MQRPEETRPRDRIWLAGIMAFVLAVSCFVVLAHNDYFLLGDLNQPNNDDVKYVRSAQTLLEGGPLTYINHDSGTEPSAFIMPGMPLLLAAFIGPFGEQGGIVAFRLFQCLEQAACVYILFLIARRVFDRRVAFVACVIMALYPPDYFSSGVILTESTFRLLCMLLVLSMMIAAETRKGSSYIAVGVLTAAAAYFKPHASLLPGVMLFLWMRERYSVREMAKFTAMIAGTFILLLCPWWIRNMLTFDRFILFTSSAGSPFLLGTRINYQMPPAGFFDAYPQYDPATLFKGWDDGAISKGLDILRYGFSHHFWTYLRWYTLGKLEGLYIDPYYWRPIWPIQRPLMDALQKILMSVTFVGFVWALIRERFGRMLPLLLTFAYFTAIYIPFVAFGRYGYPTIAFILPFAAYGLCQAWDFIRLRHKVRIKSSGRYTFNK
ncbi:glycosyltransferase family 39 protein [Saccharibacillus sp. VR-M41]|uniref:Glycosyltransferase family 39 protein n=2 Tax=Saccharibacillus alkalitolerans TaxID=2705290 RepID=A0ABX0F4T0_9BACL|nr:glycosyltransferase family 39 protein [Saccharibacillus alkalitolerans]